jgi:uncharacterized glyoxalase superfamily protein PhnB
MGNVKAIPEGFHTITATMNVEGCGEAVELYKKAFGAEVVDLAMDPSGKKIMHGDLKIGSSHLFVADVFPEMGMGGARTASLWLYVENIDASYKRAVDAGMKGTMPPVDMFWGDRFGRVTDKWGNDWSLAQRIKNMTPAEMKTAQEGFYADMAKQKK